MPEIKAPVVNPSGTLTQHQKIIALMCMNNTKTWWLPQDFMGMLSGEFFVGYEASARLSELQKDNPEMFQSRRNGKYMERSISFDTIEKWLPNAPKDFKAVIAKYYKANA